MEREGIHGFACGCQITGGDTVFLALEEAVAHLAVAQFLDVFGTQPALLGCSVDQNHSDYGTDDESDGGHRQTDVTCVDHIVRDTLPDLGHGLCLARTELETETESQPQGNGRTRKKRLKKQCCSQKAQGALKPVFSQKCSYI